MYLRFLLGLLVARFSHNKLYLCSAVRAGGGVGADDIDVFACCSGVTVDIGKADVLLKQMCHRSGKRLVDSARPP